jgi:hypothetical protein
MKRCFLEVFQLISNLPSSFDIVKIINYRKIDGWLSSSEALGLYHLSKGLKKNSVVVEIGSWQGKSTYCLAKGLPENGFVIAIDPFDASGEQESEVKYVERARGITLLEMFQKNMIDHGVSDRIRVFQGFSYQFIEKIEKIDLLFIDGDHSIQGCDFDFINYSKLVTVGGLIAFHDYDKRRKNLGPTWVIENRVMPSSDFEFVTQFDTLWVCRKRTN